MTTETRLGIFALISLSFLLSLLFSPGFHYGSFPGLLQRSLLDSISDSSRILPRIPPGIIFEYGWEFLLH